MTVEIKSTKKKAKKEVKLEEAAILAPVGHKQSKFDLPAIMLLLRRSKSATTPHPRERSGSSD